MPSKNRRPRRRWPPYGGPVRAVLRPAKPVFVELERLKTRAHTSRVNLRTLVRVRGLSADPIGSASCVPQGRKICCWSKVDLPFDVGCAPARHFFAARQSDAWLLGVVSSPVGLSLFFCRLRKKTCPAWPSRGCFFCVRWAVARGRFARIDGQKFMSRKGPERAFQFRIGGTLKMHGSHFVCHPFIFKSHDPTKLRPTQSSN